jgi:hypothetical protein
MRLRAFWGGMEKQVFLPSLKTALTSQISHHIYEQKLFRIAVSDAAMRNLVYTSEFTIFIFSIMKDNVIITICGAEKKGKTDAIAAVFKKMNNSANFKIVKDYRKSDERDIYVIGIYYGKIVGILGAGDPQTTLSDRLKELIREKCSIILCAARHPRMFRYVKSAAVADDHPEYDIIRTLHFELQRENITTELPKEERDLLNDAYADGIISLIRMLN